MSSSSNASPNQKEPSTPRRTSQFAFQSQQTDKDGQDDESKTAKIASDKLINQLSNLGSPKA